MYTSFDELNIIQKGPLRLVSTQRKRNVCQNIKKTICTLIKQTKCTYIIMQFMSHECLSALSTQS